MRPSVLIIEPRREVAEALEGVVNSANYVAVVRPHVERLTDVGVTPAAIIVRITFEARSEPAHVAVRRLGVRRPPVIAITWDDEELAEAERLKCDIILRGPQDIARLCDALNRLVNA